MSDPGRTGPNDGRRQSDLDLGFDSSDAKQTGQLSVPLRINLNPAEAKHAVQYALRNGFKRDNPNWSIWTDHERKDAVVYWLLGLMHEDLNK